MQDASLGSLRSVNAGEACDGVESAKPRTFHALAGAVIFHMRLGGVLGMLGGMDVVSMGQMRVVRSFFVTATRVMLGGLVVMVCR